MGIDKHLMLTLERSGDRQKTIFGASTAMQTPADKTFFVKGHDNKDFNDDMKSIAIAAEQDGFPYIHNFAHGISDHFLAQSASGVAQAWNFSRILRYIAMGDDICLVTWDDRVLTLPFPFIETIATALQERKEEFYFWQLRIRMSIDDKMDNMKITEVYPDLIDNVDSYIELRERNAEMWNEVLNEKWVLDYQQFKKDQYQDMSMITEPEKYIDKYIQVGHCGYDESLIISPEGATWLLLQAFEMEELDPDYNPTEEFHWKRTLYRRNCFDAWMGNDLVDPVNEAISDSKGIYCPGQIGYRFVDEWLPMGSDVDWVNKSNTEYESFRTKSTDINFLEVP